MPRGSWEQEQPGMNLVRWLSIVGGMTMFFVICCSVDPADLQVKPVGSLADREACTRADLYFISWSTSTVTAMHPADVKRHPDLTLNLLDRFVCQRFAAWLRLDELAASP